MKSTLKKFIPLAAVGIFSAATTVGTYQYFHKDEHNKISDSSYFTSANNGTLASLGAYPSDNSFVNAAKKTVPAVVTIKNYQNRANYQAPDQDLFDFFFGDPFRRGGQTQPRTAPQPQRGDIPAGLGSGVVISPDGYIITNNHVIQGANKLTVTLTNRKTYTAKVIGSDPSSDIALLKIDENNLPFLAFADSDQLQVGQWVLAVGNPLGLNSTVTAGIVSAKGRSINILGRQSKTPIESFIQTDAVINRGNSGGALVNTNGELVGINSAISSSSGYYEGYGFAVPSNLAKKVVEDIKKYGIVQRGFLGISIVDLSDSMGVQEYNKQYKTNLKANGGIYIREVQSNSGAADAGLRKGDIITNINDKNINDYADLSLAIGSERPGDVVNITYLRNGKKETADVTLKDLNGNTKTRTKDQLSVTEKLGSKFQPLSDDNKVYYGLKSGVVCTDVDSNGLLASKTGIDNGYIITEVNGKPVNSQKDIESVLKNYKGNVSIKYLDEYGRLTSRGFVMP
ncbi:Do family serine endopeptidase [Riemerella columbipharyngis]|uniref:Do/DeqQ family serine protease n=1 Tax=Riemerella columbipharyngis TaxID=1071918 RepID=A0A1G7ESB2_9FLAO|nr:Do family serine endopeptidase [Riemerella columbipharyngis]SDE66560.1 Do/DeqQ family serine protease [Riemerella columbipharyngis]